MKNIISSFLVFCLFLVSQVGFAQDRVVKQVHIDAAKKDITEIKKHIELTSVEEEGIYKVLLDKNEYLNEYPTISVVRRNSVIYSYIGRINNLLNQSSEKGKFEKISSNQDLLKKINLNIVPETNN